MQQPTDINAALRFLFASRLLNIRTERGLSQDELADMIGVNKATISKYENRINPPKLTHALALADALHISFMYLIGLSDFPYEVEVRHIAEVYEQLNDDGRVALHKYADYLLSDNDRL